jgi:hypothetical protein
MSDTAQRKPASLFRSLSYAGALALSGMVFPISLLAFLGRQTPVIDRDTLLLLSQLTYLSSLGILVSKSGLDSWYLSRTASDPSTTVNYPLVVGASVLPINFILCLLALGLGTPVAIVTCAAVSITLEAPSSVRSAELSGRMRYKRVIVASWLNMPVFTALIISLVIFRGSHEPLSPWQVGVALIMANTARACVLFSGGAPRCGGAFPKLSHRLALGGQQLLQYLMFRADALSATFLLSNQLPQLPALLFWARFQELAGGGAALGSMFLTPRMLAGRHRDVAGALAVWGAGATAAGLLTWLLLQGFEGGYIIATLATLNASLALGVTLTIQRLLAEQRLKRLVFLSVQAVATGGLTLAFLYCTQNLALVPLAVSAQLMFFWLACRAPHHRSSQLF